MKVMENCYREYYYTYYGSHNGWIDNVTDEQKVAWRLKKLTNIWLMFGDKLHDVIKKTIKNKHNLNITPNYLKEYMRKVLNHGVKESIRMDYGMTILEEKCFKSIIMVRNLMRKVLKR